MNVGFSQNGEGFKRVYYIFPLLSSFRCGIIFGPSVSLV